MLRSEDLFTLGTASNPSSGSVFARGGRAAAQLPDAQGQILQGDEQGTWQAREVDLLQLVRSSGESAVVHLLSWMGSWGHTRPKPSTNFGTARWAQSK